MTRNQVKNVEAALTGPRTRSKAAVLEKSSVQQEHTVRWGHEETAAAKILVSMKNMSVSVEKVNNATASQRPRRSCATY